MTEPASEKKLTTLHQRVADTMLRQLQDKDTAFQLLEEFKDEIPEEVKEFLETYSVISPALLAVCTKFLKDNEVTCQPEKGEAMSELQQRLASKRKPLGDIPAIDEPMTH